MLLILLKGNMLASMYYLKQLEDDKSGHGIMNKRKHISFGKQLYITKGESAEYVYLCEVSQKNVRDMTIAQRESVPDEEDAYELVLYDIDNLDD